MGLHMVFYGLQDHLGTMNVRLSDDGGGETIVWLYPNPGQDLSTEDRYETVLSHKDAFEGNWGSPVSSGWESERGYGWLGNIEDDRHTIAIIVVPEDFEVTEDQEAYAFARIWGDDDWDDDDDDDDC